MYGNILTLKRSKVLQICPFTVFSVISITGEKLHNRSSIPVSHALFFFFFRLTSLIDPDLVYLQNASVDYFAIYIGLSLAVFLKSICKRKQLI